MAEFYRLIMDERINPLAALPAPQRFQIMVSLVFKSTSLDQVRQSTYRDYPAKDGTARYDDVWGA